ncbi:MAG: glycosyltransferase family 9 protein [Desulfobulbaceae bacterium]|nr:glycosyltransferase family 9 protein [Desulfobulbaceae bacterium]
MAVAERILIIKPSSLGDIIHTLPLAHALKRCKPQCSIGWVVERAFHSLLSADSAIDAIYPIHIPSTSNPDSSKSAYLAALRATVATLCQLRHTFGRQPYDEVLDLQASFRSGLLALMNPGGRRAGFADARELNTLFQHVRIAVPAAITHALDKNLLFAAHLGCAVKPEDFFLSTSVQAEEEVNTFLQAEGLALTTRLVYMQPAARWQSKHWLVERWARLADRLAHRGLQAVFGGSAGDLPLLEEIGRRMQGPLLIAAGRLSLVAGAALIKRSALYVGVDTGPMHMAALAGRPVVALFGPTHPERVGPYNTRNRVLQARGLDCLCCRKRYCSHQSCMQAITVETVEQAVLELLAKKAENGSASAA